MNIDAFVVKTPVSNVILPNESFGEANMNNAETAAEEIPGEREASQDTLTPVA